MTHHASTTCRGHHAALQRPDERTRGAAAAARRRPRAGDAADAAAALEPPKHRAGAEHEWAGAPRAAGRRGGRRPFGSPARNCEWGGGPGQPVVAPLCGFGARRGREPQGNHFTPLLAAFTNQTDENALYLINEAGADVNARWADGLTPLMRAASKGYVEVLKALVAKGADVEAMINEGGGTAVSIAIETKQMEAALYLLEEAGAAWDYPDSRYLLITAAAAGSYEFINPLVRHMRSKGVSEGDITKHLTDAAHGVIQLGLPMACLEALAAGGLDLKAARVKFATRMIPLFHAACKYDRTDAAAFLLEQGCDPKEPDSLGSLPQHMAAASDRIHMLQWLQTVTPIDINAPTIGDSLKMTMLHVAAASGRMAVVKWLVEQGADVRLLSAGLQASDLAEEHDHTAIAAYLREQEAAADARDRAEQAAAEAAVRRARNEKRRQKKKKGKARRRAAEGADAGGGEEEEGEDEEEQEQELAAAMAGLRADDTAAVCAEEEVGTETAVGERGASAAAAAPAATDSEDEDGMKEAAAVSSPSAVARPLPLEEYLEAEAPDGLLCPISMALLDDPVLLVADGETYSRAAIEQHFAFCRERGKPLTAPSTNMEITDPALTMLAPNVRVRGQVLEYKAAKERAWAEAERRWRDAAGEGAN